MSAPPVNYRAQVMQIEDAYRVRHGSPLHACGECLGEVLKGIVQPMLEIAVSTGMQLKREEIIKQQSEGK